MAAKTKAALTYIDISCNIIRNLNLVHIIRTHTGSLPSCRKDIVSQEKHYVCKNLYFNGKYSTEHDNAYNVPVLLQCGPATDFSLMIGLNIIANGVATFTHHTLASFLRNWNLFVTL